MANNRICKLLGIRYPIVQAPMNWISGTELVAAVSNAGGLGSIGPNSGAKTITVEVGLTGDRLRQQIRKVKSLTREPFAVNIVIGAGERRQYSQRCLEVVLEEVVPVVITSVGSPDVYTKVLKDAGIKVLHSISTPRHAQKAEEAGVDAVICEGFEGGGHKSFTGLTTFVLVPMVADAVKVPILAAGGIADVRGALAALVLGADGIYMGTRLMVTHESEAHAKVKEAVLKAEDVCTTSTPKDMMFARDLKNLFTEQYLKMKEAGASSAELNNYLEEHAAHYALVRGDVDNAEVFCGQVAGLIKDIASTAEVIHNIVDKMAPYLEEIKEKLVTPHN